MAKKKNSKEITDEVNKEEIPAAEEAVDPQEAGTAEGTEEVPETEIKPVDNPKAVIGAVLFSVGNSVEYKKLAAVLGRDAEETKKLVYALKDDYDNDPDCGFTIIELEDSVQMCSKASMYEYLIKIAKVPKSYSLTDSMLETLSIIAYKQPVTKAEIEKIRGVKCDHAVNKLVEYDLVTELGRLDAPGRPILFGTTEEFLRIFGVEDVEELPQIDPVRLEDFKAEAEAEAAQTVEV